ncbi:MAG: exopolysaccharide biosynthesis protein, partial [Pseudomonadota bacterium]
MSAQASNEGPESIHEVVDRTMETAENEEKLQVGDLLDSFGSRAFGPLFFILGAIPASPIGSIPGASIVIGALLLLLAAQMIFTDDAPW